MSKETVREKEEKAFRVLCQSISNSSSLPTLKAKLYERIESHGLSGYAPEHRAPVKLGAYEAVNALFKVLEENAVTPEPSTQSEDAREY